MVARFAEACEIVESALTVRPAVVREHSTAADLRAALLRLRTSIHGNLWNGGGRTIDVARIVAAYDARTTDEGFHVLRDWDGRADAVLADTIPIDVLNYLIEQRGGEPPDAILLAIVADYYFLYLLVLLSVRVWDDGDADANLDRLEELLARLQGPHGSGHRFVANAATLLLLAGSHYELSDSAYDRLLARIKALAPRHHLAIALSHAASLGGHLRFGFEATYGRDTAAMRADNTPDYPWLCFALLTLVREYASSHESGATNHRREILAEAIVNGLSPDPAAFLFHETPTVLAGCEPERQEIRQVLCRLRQPFLSDVERHRPTERAYSPLSLFFNFSHNVVKGTVVDALLWGEPRTVTLNDLLYDMSSCGDDGTARLALAQTLMTYARAHPHTIRGRATPVIVYDPASGRQAFGGVMRALGSFQ